MSTKIPSAETLNFCFKLSLEDDKPILTDYWEASLTKGAFIGVRGEGADKVQLLVKSDDEYTSPIKKIRKSGTDYIVATENSIYICSTEIAVKKIA
jgi:hypothetical protein